MDYLLQEINHSVFEGCDWSMTRVYRIALQVHEVGFSVLANRDVVPC